MSAQSAIVYDLHKTHAANGIASAQTDNVFSLPGRIEDDARDALEMAGARMTFDRDEEVFGEGEASDFVYRVISGAVRSYKLLSDGRRQIGDFHLAGDLFGLEAGEEHRLSAEAICKTEVMVYRKSALFSLAARTPSVGRALWSETARELERAQTHLMLLGRKSACERVATFLMSLAEREPACEEVALPMSRQDMADYLGLTIETVSRTFTQLQGDGLIALKGCRRVQIRNRSAFARLAA
jgi:CRP/FNR family nitrogen fixation transcriptional regulator